MLEPLISTIKTLQERIEAHGVTLRDNEIRTRMSLVDPLLVALGWDTSDPAVVLPEYAVSGRADYALLREDGRPAAFIEAKKLGEPLDGHRMQMLNYSNAAGVDTAGLTNGDDWELYSVFERGPLSERLLLQTTILSSDIHRCALEFLLLWRPNIGVGRPISARSPVLATLPNELSSSVLTKAQPEPELTTRANPTEELHWIPLSQINPRSGDTPPRAIRFERGPEIQIKSWVRILIETVEWLCAGGQLIAADCPVEAGRNRNLVATEPVHRHGREFRNSHQTRNGLFLECNYSSKNCIDLSRFLLRRFGIREEVIELVSP